MPCRYYALTCVAPIAERLSMRGIAAKMSSIIIHGSQSLLNNVYAYIRDRDLYTTTNKCLQCLIKLMYTVL